MAIAVCPCFWGVITGMLFAKEFTLVFQALVLTTVPRTSTSLYVMSIWLVPAMGGVGRRQANRLGRVFGLYWS
ncbi:hypothetical protein [Tateyamaria sp.]|uniref:hypothetical protein n=1 Tax=Tateyamaria sp. TaxID=1929288 RepID=UPI00329B7512